MEFTGKHVHFVGVGGISMSALAVLLLRRGAFVSGSDLIKSEQTEALEKLGVRFFNGHAGKNIAGADVVVVNGAIVDENPELIRARELRLPVMMREDLVAFIEKDYKNRIAVAGTHGKSTTVAMIGDILDRAGLQPTVHNGAAVIGGGCLNNIVIGKNDYFVTEACEFKRSFLRLSPSVAVVTNVDADHLDCYKDIFEIKEVFSQFCNKAESVIVNGDCPNSGELVNGRTVTFGITGDCDIRAVNIEEWKRGKYAFDLSLRSKTDAVHRVKLSVCGRHNIYNALAAAAAGLHLGVDSEFIVKALSDFKGIKRRFEELGEISVPEDGEKHICKLITDYAHHPTEIAATVATAESLFDRFLVVFQPHTYTRTIALFGGFVSVLGKTDCVLYKTFAAREKPVYGGGADDLAKALGVRYFADARTLSAFIKKQSAFYDAVILTGAGTVNKINITV